MRCEEARRRLHHWPDAEAEAHLAACPTCFEELERGDSLVALIQQARPQPVPAPALLASRVIARWRMRRRLPWAAAAAVLVAASFAAAALIWALAPAFNEGLWVGQASAEGVLLPFGLGLLGLAELLRSHLVENPAWLTALVVVAAAGAAASAALYREARPAGERVPS
jgi:hypothetical protein